MNQTISSQTSRVPTAGQPDSFARAAARLDRERPLRGRRLLRIAVELKEGQVAVAHKELNDYLAKHPDDIDATFLIAESLVRLGRRSEAAARFEQCLEVVPDFFAARFGYARVLLRLNRFDDALAEANRLLAKESRNPLFLQLKANALLAMGDGQQSLSIWQQLAADNSTRAESWIQYGDALRATGHFDEAVAAYRRAITCSPSSGSAWWSLADLKTYRFSDADVASMQNEANQADLATEERINFLFALGKAYEDHGAYDRSFEHYAKANAAKRLLTKRYPQIPAARISENRALFTSAFLRSRGGAGCDASAPIFVLGLQRSGSTLVEQILSSHSAIEGVGELKYIPALAERLVQGEPGGQGMGYPDILGQLDSAEFCRLGEEYLVNAGVHRRLNRPHFIDKNPGNYLHLGLIHLMLPKAKILDVRRHPAACCLSIFKQNLGTASLRLNELGQNYRDYVELMAHFERVLPGKVHRVIYEDLVSDPEGQVRNILNYLRLPFEEACLRFHECGRMLLTPSSEQVRQPISAASIGEWRNFEPLLKPLLDSLGAVFSAYPAVPEEMV